MRAIRSLAQPLAVFWSEVSGDDLLLPAPLLVLEEPTVITALTVATLTNTMPGNEHFADSMQAKRFLVSRIVEEARRQNEPLADVEEQMLYFSETSPTLPNMMQIAERFENEVDSEKYEAKIFRLANNARSHDRQQCPENTPLWKEAIKLLRKEDHYIMVMLDSLGASSPSPIASTNKDQWRLLGYGLLTVSLIAVFLVPIFVYKIDLPKWAVEAVVIAIAGAVYWLSKCMERRTK